MQQRILIVPGIGDSGAQHWQSLWQQRHAGITRIAPGSWDAPECGDWVAAIERALIASGPQTLIVAHSLGCLAVAHWAARRHAKDDGAGRGVDDLVAGALLVAVPDPQEPAFPAAARGFAPLPQTRLPFASIVVASDDDPYARPEHAQRYAALWGSRLQRIGKRGHINAASNLNDWPEGWQLLEGLQAR